MPLSLALPLLPASQEGAEDLTLPVTHQPPDPLRGDWREPIDGNSGRMRGGALGGEGAERD